MKAIKVGSDFSGVGAFDQALIRLGINYETIFACDMDKYARQTFIENYGEPKYYPENVYDRDIPEESLDIYMTSPPCQGFSLAGKRGGSILFLNSHEFIKQNNPRYFIFENVKGLLSHDKKDKDAEFGNTFNQWINYLGGKSINQLIINNTNTDHLIPGEYSKTLRCGGGGSLTEKHNYDMIKVVGNTNPSGNGMNGNVFDEEGISPTLSTNKGEGIKVKSATKKGFETANEGDSINFSVPSSGTRRGRVGKGVAQTLDTACNQATISESRIRRLTPREVFRLMDFPDSFTWPVSNSQAYKQGGNSIVVGVLAKTIERLKL